jgi:hypothetical protein
MNTRGRGDMQFCCFGPNFGRGGALYTFPSNPYREGAVDTFPHNLSGRFTASTPVSIEGAVYRNRLRAKTNPSSAGEQLGPPLTQTRLGCLMGARITKLAESRKLKRTQIPRDGRPSSILATILPVSTVRDIKAATGSNRESARESRGQLLSKHDLEMLRGFAPRTPKSTPREEAGKTPYGEIQ